MPLSGNTEYDKLLKYLEKSNLSLEEINKQYAISLDRISSHETSWERLNRLQKEANEKLQNYDDLLKEGNNKEINEKFEKRIELLKEIDKIEKEQFKLRKNKQTKSTEYKDNQSAIKAKKAEVKALISDIEKLGLNIEDAEKLHNKLNELRLESGRKVLEQQNEFNKRQDEGITRLDDWNEWLQKITKAFRKGVKDVGDGINKVGKSAWNILEPWRKANQEAMNYARTMGMSQKTAEKYLSKTVSWASKNNIGILFNKTTDELIKMQGKYSEVLGRNVQLTNEQKIDMLAMEKFLGEDGMTDIANNLENFGFGMSDSAEFVKKTYDEATRYGISASKLTKTIRENIKMAQNYTFKNGLEGLSNMARKAVELKTDMSFVNSFIDKVSTVEGAITTGAQLQVLGGNYALGSDPLSMLNESLNNVEGLFDRAVGMAQGKVFYNETTGNFEMGAMDRYMMRQAATSMGVDPSKMIDVAFRQASLDKIEGEARLNSEISNDEKMISLIKNLATWNNGEGVINIDGEDKRISDITADDKAKLEMMSRSDTDTLRDMAISLRSTNEKIEGIKKESLNKQADALQGISEKFDNLLDNTALLSKIAIVMSTGRLLRTGYDMIMGGFQTLNGTLRIFAGSRNIATLGKPVMRGVRGGSAANKLKRMYAARQGGHSNLAKSILSKNTGRMAAGVLGYGAAGGLMSLGGDILTGEFKKDMSGSIGRAAGTAIGGVIGGFFGPMGAMIGSSIGQWASRVIQKKHKENREKIRKDIANEFSAAMPNIGDLFAGENSLQGNYNAKQLNKLKAALADGRIDDEELNWRILRKARANDDLKRMRDAGVRVNVAMGNGGIINNNYRNSHYASSYSSSHSARYDSGGFLIGNSHANGGMPILGSNIVVEGGEYVINKKATQENLPLLNQINSGEYKMTAKEPLGKQMKVHNRNYDAVSNMPHNSKLNIQPISINLSGTIKLDSGNRQFDITNEILSNPQLITKLTEMINKQINILDNGSYNKGNFRQKFA